MKKKWLQKFYDGILYNECDGMAAGGVRRQVMSEKGRQKKMQKKSGGRIQIFIQFVIVT